MGLSKDSHCSYPNTVLFYLVSLMRKFLLHFLLHNYVMKMFTSELQGVIN
jgi:hypothetical protein